MNDDCTIISNPTHCLSEAVYSDVGEPQQQPPIFGTKQVNLLKLRTSLDLTDISLTLAVAGSQASVAATNEGGAGGDKNPSYSSSIITETVTGVP